MKKHLILTLILNALIGLSLAQIPTNGLVAYYPFTGSANDVSGNGHTGTVIGASLTTDRYGAPNCAYSFDGINNHILTNVQVGFSYRFTISAWILTSNIPGSNHQAAGIFCARNAYDHINSLQIDGGGTGVMVNIDRNIEIQQIISTGGINIDNNQWRHVVGVYDSNSVRIYVDDTLKVNSPVTPWAIQVLNPFIIGYDNTPGSSSNRYFIGKIDDIAVYNRALTPSEIHQIFVPCTTPAPASITALGPTTFCHGSDVFLTCNNTNVTYQWKKNGVAINGATGKNYSAKAAGTYKCIVTCGGSTSTSNGIALTRLDNTANTITSTGSAAFCAGDSLLLSSTNSTAGYTYQWYRSNVSIIGATGKDFTAKNPGTYKVVSKHPTNGCSRISSNSVSATVNCRMANPGLISGPTEVQENNKINLFPNPNNGSFTIEFLKENAEDGTASIEVINTLGKTIFTTKTEFLDGHLSQEINLQNGFSKGIYMVNIILNGEKISSKVLLQ